MAMDEGSPYVTAENSINHYSWTKAQAERLVLGANGSPLATRPGNLSSASIRPCSGIFGPNDVLITEKALTSGNVEVLIPDSKIDYVYVENVVWGHMLLEKQLLTAPDRVGGQPFCISNEDPIVCDDFYSVMRFF